MKICEEQHTFRIGDGHKDLQGLQGEERENKIAELTKEFEARYALYVGHTMLQFQHWESIVAPYNFGLVLVCIYHKHKGSH
jgi:hypothetical protein